MTLEEIQKLSDAELGEKLAWELTGISDCKVYKYAGDLRVKSLGGMNASVIRLCEYLDIMRTIEKIVNDLDWTNYGDAILRVIDERLDGFNSLDVATVAMISARQRAEACLLALQS